MSLINQLMLAVLGLRCCEGSPLVALSGSYSLAVCSGSSLRWPLLLGARALEHAGFSSCSTWAQQLQLAGSRAQAQQSWHRGQLLCSMQDLPRPGIKSVSPALAGEFFTTEPPQKPGQFLLYSKVNQLYAYICPLCFGFPSHLGHHRALSLLC